MELDGLLQSLPLFMASLRLDHLVRRDPNDRHEMVFMVNGMSFPRFKGR
jgi:hypothetical protein